MKIRIIKELFGGPAHSIKAGTELYGRIVQVDPLCKMFQCTDGEYIGREIPFKFYVEIPEDKTFAELRVIELEQENLQRLEEVKGLQRQVESLTEFGNKKVEQIRHLKGEVSKAWTTYSAERESRMLFETTLERAMLDQQPVVLPKVIYDALVYYDNPDTPFTKFGIMECIIKEPCQLAKDARMEMFRLNIDDLVYKALVNGYTVESPEDAAIKEVAGMLDKWTDEDYVSEGSVVDENRKFAKEIVNRVKAYSE